MNKPYNWLVTFFDNVCVVAVTCPLDDEGAWKMEELSRKRDRTQVDKHGLINRTVRAVSGGQNDPANKRYTE